MSEASTLVDAVLGIVTAQVTGVTVRNAITEGFKSEDQLSSGELPWCQGFNVEEESDAIEFGQRFATYQLNFELLREPDQGEQAWTDIDAIRAAVLADYTLGSLAYRSWMSASGVDETSSRDFTLAAFQVTATVQD